MSDVPVQVIVAAFQDEEAAKGVLKALKQARKEGLIKIENAAVLRKDEKGKLHIKETHDMGGGKGAALGGVGGAAIGLVAGAALAALVVVGALVAGAGYYAGKKAAEGQQDECYQDQQIADLQDQVDDLQETPVNTSSPAPASSPDMVTRLQQLADLHASGVLSDVEFEAAKKKILTA